MADAIQWEYRVATVGSALSGVKDPELEAMLNEWGQEGWEVFSAENPASSSKVRLVAKRPLSASTRRQRTWPGA